ncbi:hypothetical protein [Streptomyces sp. MnatMP-M17]|uniref:hypothetical protein n=1 Tax=unclassified Streptomyces TaxID=2593676 RepID=UPI00210EACDF|nr:hypothetical protein [Streptomyces sp. MnatMP-M17]
MQKANTYMQKWDKLPTSLPQSPPGPYSPLESKPRPGGKVISLTLPIPSALTSSKAMSAAAQTAGWTNKIVNYDGSVPDLITKFDQALSERPTRHLARRGRTRGDPAADRRGEEGWSHRCREQRPGPSAVDAGLRRRHQRPPDK